jgi:predicted NBD/HSP70 family sugar kinase
MSGCHVGVDIGGTRLRAIAEDDAGRRTDPVEIRVPRTVPDTVASIAELAERAAGGAAVSAVAVGLPGQVTPERSVWMPNLRFLDGVPLAAAVADRVGAPCELLNDAQATLLAESAEGAAAGRRDVVLLAVGTGIGGAILLGGQLVRGAHGCAGAFGWLPFPGAEADADHGAWERAGSGRRLEELAAPWGTVAELMTAARGGDDAARSVVAGIATVLGRGAAGLASILDPELIVFAGGLVSAFDLLEDGVRGALTAHASPAGRTVPVVPAALGSTAGVVGALHAARRIGSAAPSAPKGRLS